MLFRLGRIIPACAGKSGEAVDAINNDQDHPRMRGEKKDIGISNVFFSGSSPHARGKDIID